MKTKIYTAFILLVSMASGLVTNAQQSWPRSLTAPDGTRIKLYEPQSESLSGGVLKFRSVISVQDDDQGDPVFGTQWSVANVATESSGRNLTLRSVKVPNLKLASDTNDARINYLRAVLEAQMPDVIPTLDVEQVNRSIARNSEEKKQSSKLNNDAPEIVYADRPSMLVLIDGEPKWQQNPDWGLDAVVNSPFTIVREGGSIYLYGGKRWYKASSINGPYTPVNALNSNLQRVENAVNAMDNNNPGYANKGNESAMERDIIISTHPAELVQTRGEAVLTPIDGTRLSYVSNSDNDIFKDDADGKYYILLSGRWYRSNKLSSGWQYVPSANLPADFARIPEGSPKDNVLASVAGTEAARDAVMDAQVPQTAKVDRNQANAEVTYDGQPRFQDVPGTRLQYATNTQSSVVRYGHRYYVVDRGVWFQADSPDGPWYVATERPADIDIIPPSSPVYNLKYVYIYDVTPDYVYMGYTPGYLNTFVYGPTVVYGTGWYYRPWWGNYYYPRPYTWGFSFHYNPWYGWSLGFGYSSGWFNYGWGSGCWGGWSGGWWGPRMYHPPYHCYSGYGYYGRGGYYDRRYANYGYSLNRNYNGNMYGFRRDVATYDNRNIQERRNGFGRESYAGGARGNYGNGRNGNSGYGDRGNRNGAAGYGDRGDRNGNNVGGYNGNFNGADRGGRSGNPSRSSDPAGGANGGRNNGGGNNVGGNNNGGGFNGSNGRGDRGGVVNGPRGFGNGEANGLILDRKGNTDRRGGLNGGQGSGFDRGSNDLPGSGQRNGALGGAPSYSQPQQGSGGGFGGGNAPVFSRPQQGSGGGWGGPSRSFSAPSDGGGRSFGNGGNGGGGSRSFGNGGGGGGRSFGGGSNGGGGGRSSGGGRGGRGR